MASKVNIFNMALVNMGSSGFIQAADEASAEAAHLRVVYDNSVEATLEALDWNFARVKVALADLDTPDDDWVYQYAYPANCVKARKILTSVRSAKPPPFEIGLNAAGSQKVINTDVEGAVLIYTARVTNTALFDSAFSEALSWKLALAAAGPLAGNDDKVFNKCRLGFAQALSQAQTINMNEGQEDEEPDASWVTGR